MHPNLSMNLLRDSLSACRKLANAVNVICCDRLVAYCALKRSIKCQSCRWTLEEVHRTKSMSPLWGTLGRHDIGFHLHWCTSLPRSGKHPYVHLDWCSCHTAPGWVVSNLGVCQLLWCVDEGVSTISPIIPWGFTSHWKLELFEDISFYLGMEVSHDAQEFKVTPMRFDVRGNVLSWRFELVCPV